MKYAIDYILGRLKYTLVAEAPDRDDAYDECRRELRARGFISASLQGCCRVASGKDIEDNASGAGTYY